MDRNTKKKLITSFNKFSDLKEVLKDILQKDMKILWMSITPENNDWNIILDDGPIEGLCYVDKDKINVELLNGEAKDLSLSEARKIINDKYDPIVVGSYHIRLGLEDDNEYIIESSELLHILNEDILLIAQKAKEEVICQKAMKYLNKYFVETSDERIFPKRFFRGKTFRHVCKNMLKYEADLLKIRQRGRVVGLDGSIRLRVNHLLCTIDSAFWHLNCMRLYGRRVPRNGSKIS